MLLHKSNIKIIRYHRSKSKIFRNLQHESKLRYLYSGSLSSAPQPPQNLSVSNVGETTADLDWDEPINGNFDDYTVRAINPNDDSLIDEQEGVSVTSYTFLNLPQESIDFRVMSVDNGIESDPSTFLLLPPPDNILVTVNNEQVDLSWDAVDDADGYNVYADQGQGFVKQNGSLITGTSHSIITDGSNQIIQIYVVAARDGIESLWSNIIEAEIETLFVHWNESDNTIVSGFTFAGGDIESIWSESNNTTITKN